MTHRWGLLALVVSASVLMSGCTPQPALVASTPSPTAAASAPADVDVDMDKAFRTIVDASCARAYEVGVTESVVGTDTRLVLVPVANAYNDFTAAVVNNDAGLSPIWSTEEFAVCIDSINFSMVEDGGSSYEIAVSGDLAAGQLRSEYTVEDYGVFVTDYVVTDGLITNVVSQTPDATTQKEIRYGMPSDADIRRFQEAIDSFLADQ